MATAPDPQQLPVQFSQLDPHAQSIWGCGYVAARHNFTFQEAANRYADESTRQVFAAGYLTANSLREGQDGNRITSADYMVSRFLGMLDTFQTLMAHIPLEWFESANSGPVKAACDRIIEQLTEGADDVEKACHAAQIR